MLKKYLKHIILSPDSKILHILVKYFAEKTIMQLLFPSYLNTIFSNGKNWSRMKITYLGDNNIGKFEDTAFEILCVTVPQ